MTLNFVVCNSIRFYIKSWYELTLRQQGSQILVPRYCCQTGYINQFIGKDNAYMMLGYKWWELFERFLQKININAICKRTNINMVFIGSMNLTIITFTFKGREGYLKNRRIQRWLSIFW